MNTLNFLYNSGLSFWLLYRPPDTEENLGKWKCEHWGTESEPDDIHITFTKPNSMYIYFCHDRFPKEFFTHLANQYPDLRIFADWGYSWGDAMLKGVFSAIYANENYTETSSGSSRLIQFAEWTEIDPEYLYVEEQPPTKEQLEWDEKRIQQEHWYDEEEPPRDEELTYNVYEMLELEDTTDIDFWTDPEPMVSIYNGMFDNHDWVDYDTWVSSIIAREEELEYYELEQDYDDCCIYLESDEDIIAYQNQLSPKTFFIPTPPPPIPSMSEFPKEEIDALIQAYSCKNDKRIHEFLLKYKRLPFDICGRIHYSFRPSIGTYVLPYCIHNGMLHTALHCIDVLFETPQNLEEFKSYMDSLSFELIQDRNLEYWYAEDTLGCFSSIDYEESEYWDWDITYYHDGVEHREMKKKILLALNRKLKEQFCGTAKALSQVSLFSGLPYLSPDVQRHILEFVDTPSFVSKKVLDHPAFKYDDPFEDPKYAVDFPDYSIEFDPDSVYTAFLELDDNEEIYLNYYADPENYGSRRLNEWWTYDEYIQGILDYEAVLEMERFYEDTIPSDKELKWDQKRIQEAHWYEGQEEIPDEEELMLDDVRSHPLYSKAIDLGWIPTSYGHWEEIEWDVHYYDEDQEEYDTHLIYLEG